jgi:WD40 repeat protein
MAMAVLLDGNQIAISTAEDLVQLWDCRTGIIGSVLEGHEVFITDILYSSCGRWILSCEMKGSGLLWDLHGMKQESYIRAEVEE